MQPIAIRELLDFDEKYVLKFGNVIDEEGSTFIEIADRIPVSSFGLAINSDLLTRLQVRQIVPLFLLVPV